MAIVLQNQVSRIVNKIERDAIRNQGAISTGILKDFMGNLSLNKGDLVILSSNNGVAINILGLNIVQHIALRLAKKVLIFTNTVPPEEIIFDLIFMTGKISKFEAKNIGLDFEEWEKLKSAESKLTQANIVIEDCIEKAPKEIGEIIQNNQTKPNELGLIIVMNEPNIIEGLNRKKGGVHTTALTCMAYKNLATKSNLPILLTSAECVKVNSLDEKRPLLTDYPFKSGLPYIDRVIYVHENETNDKNALNKLDVELIISSKNPQEHHVLPYTYDSDRLSFKSKKWWFENEK